MGGLWEQYKRIRKETAPIVLFGAEPFTSVMINSNFREFKYNWYWVKDKATGFQYSKFQPMRRVETISVFYKRAGAYRPQGLIKLAKPKITINQKVSQLYGYVNLGREHKIEYRNYPKNVLEFASKMQNRMHPTQKPVKLLEYLIKTYTVAGDTVLDNCMGSGSTGVACINTSRNFIGIEKSEEYFEIAKQRLERAENEKA